MNGKPDWFLRVLLVLIVLLLAAQVDFQWFYPVGRYVHFPLDEKKFVILDTRSGNVYAFDEGQKKVIEINLVEQAKKQRNQKP